MKSLLFIFRALLHRRSTILLSLLIGCSELLNARAAGATAEGSPPSASNSRPVAQEMMNDPFLNKLIQILKYGDLVGGIRPTKVDAVIALGLLGDERAVPLLVEHLENEPNQHLRMQIARTLGWIGSAKAAPALEKALHDSYPHTRNQAAIALKAITGRDYDFDHTGLPVLNRALEPRPATAPAR